MGTQGEDWPIADNAQRWGVSIDAVVRVARRVDEAICVRSKGWKMQLGNPTGQPPFVSIRESSSQSSPTAFAGSVRSATHRAGGWLALGPPREVDELLVLEDPDVDQVLIDGASHVEVFRPISGGPTRWAVVAESGHGRWGSVLVRSSDLVLEQGSGTAAHFEQADRRDDQVLWRLRHDRAVQAPELDMAVRLWRSAFVDKEICSGTPSTDDLKLWLGHIWDEAYAAPGDEIVRRIVIMAKTPKARRAGRKSPGIRGEYTPQFNALKRQLKGRPKLG